MKLITLECPKCGAQMEVNPELDIVYCNYCGNKLLIDKEVTEQKVTGGFDFGYQQELGKIKAQQEYKEKKLRKERQKLKEEQQLAEKKYLEYQKKNKEASVLANCKFIRIISIELLIIGLVFSAIAYGDYNSTTYNLVVVVSGIIQLGTSLISIISLSKINLNKLMITMTCGIIGIIFSVLSIISFGWYFIVLIGNVAVIVFSIKAYNTLKIRLDMQ